MENEEVLTTQDTQQQETVRDAYADALGSMESTDAVTTDNAAAQTPAAGDKVTAAVDTTSETEQQKADRLRDEKGRFAPGKADEKAATQQASAPVTPKVQRPSSWKKDHWESFDKLAAENPALAQYIHERESQFASGVSTYKSEYDRVKPIDEAMQPIMPILQQHGRDPAEWIQTMGRVHQTFAFGTPEQKVNATLQILKDYNVPLMDFLQRGGQLPQFNPNAQQPQAPQPQVNIEQLVEQKFQLHQTQQSIKQFQEAKDASGNPLYPHFETVKPDMIGLLQAGLANDLNSAYDKALRMHDDIWQQQLADKTAAAAAEKIAAEKARVTRAKANNVSIRDSARSNDMQSQGNSDLRSAYGDGLDRVAGGRV